MSPRCIRHALVAGLLLVGRTIPATAQRAATPTQDPHLAKALKVLTSTPLIDGHNDLPWAIRESKTAPSDVEAYDLRQRTVGHTDLARLAAGRLGGQFWSVYIPGDTSIARQGYAKVQLEQIDIARRVMAKYPEQLASASSAAELRAAFQRGRIGGVLGMEGGHAIENSLGALRAFYDLGARYMTLTHNQTLEWADAATGVQRHGGLTAFGKEVVREMNRLGMLVDISHVSPATMLDTLRISKAPVLFSHSSARAIADHPRNVPDEVLAQLPSNGGVVMINFFSGFVVPESASILLKLSALRKELKAKYPDSKEDQEREVKQWQLKNPYPAGQAEIIVDHIEHVIRIAGIDHVGLGSDFDGISKLPVGIEDVSKYPVITELMLRRGYEEQAIHKVLYGNALRVLRQATELADR